MRVTRAKLTKKMWAKMNPVVGPDGYMLLPPGRRHEYTIVKKDK